MISWVFTINEIKKRGLNKSIGIIPFGASLLTNYLERRLRCIKR